VAKTVTSLRAAGPGRVAVELDGERWRTLPLEAVISAGVEAGAPLDRARARALAQELRRVRAVRVASAALRTRARSARELEERLEVHGVGARERERTVGVFASAGLVDDRRFAETRARALAERGSGDELIREDLERRGVAAEALDAAVTALEPEHERAAAIVARRGPGPKTARYLAARGFSEEAVALAVARDGAEALE